MESFFSAIVGASIALIGVLFTLRWNQRLHEDNLREERQRRKEEREFSAKQDALLSAAEAVTRFIIYYISLADRVLPSDGSVAQEITEMSIALNRLHFFCSLDTIEKSTWLVKIFTEAVTETMKEKMPSVFINEELKDIDLQIAFIERRNKSLKENIGALLQSDPQNPLIMTYREQLTKNYHAIVNSHSRRVELFKQRFIETEKCRDIISRNLRTIYEGSGDVLLLARQELSFPINQEKYKEIMEERIKSMESNYVNFLAEVRKQFTERMKQSQRDDGVTPH